MNFIIFTNQGYSLQNSSLGQLHSDGGVVSIVLCSAGRLLLEYLSARQLHSSGYYPKYQNGALSRGFWAGGIKRSHRDWDLANRGAEEPQECFFLPKIHCWRLPCDMGHCRGAASMSKSCVKIWWTVNRFKFNSLLIILNVNWRSDLTKDLTLSTLSSVFEVEGLPARGSSSTCSQSSKKDLCHLNTCALDRECSP